MTSIETKTWGRMGTGPYSTVIFYVKVRYSERLSHHMNKIKSCRDTVLSSTGFKNPKHFGNKLRRPSLKLMTKAVLKQGSQSSSYTFRLKVHLEDSDP